MSRHPSHLLMIALFQILIIVVGLGAMTVCGVLRGEPALSEHSEKYVAHVLWFAGSGLLLIPVTWVALTVGLFQWRGQEWVNMFCLLTGVGLAAMLPLAFMRAICEQLFGGHI